MQSSDVSVHLTEQGMRVFEEGELVAPESPRNSKFFASHLCAHLHNMTDDNALEKALPGRVNCVRIVGE